MMSTIIDVAEDSDLSRSPAGENESDDSLSDSEAGTPYHPVAQPSKMAEMAAAKLSKPETFKRKCFGPRALVDVKFNVIENLAENSPL